MDSTMSPSMNFHLSNFRAFAIICSRYIIIALLVFSVKKETKLKMQDARNQQNIELIPSTPLATVLNSRITWAPRKEKIFANNTPKAFCRRCVSKENCECPQETWKRNTNRKLDFCPNEEQMENKMVDESTPCPNIKQFSSLTPCSRAASTLLARSKNIDNVGGGFYPQASKRKLLYSSEMHEN